GFLGTKEVRESGIPVVREHLTQFIETADFAERKQVMEDLSDACVVLPGSFGTMDELFTYACNRAIDKHTKPMLIFNFEGYYEPLKQLLANMQEAGFMKPFMADAITFCETVEDVLAALC
ncbi:MAG: LOG family protein, partial [Firmicutes bacterium]|nr:LOG family protein [Bacillota bacterium]